MTAAPFQHSPLSPADPRAIQILELLPSRNLKSPIRCRLRHCSLDEDVQYEAVSYTWGDPEPGHTVFINGSHTIDVTPNCLEALRCLRRKFRRRNLWIDAICIDQRDGDTSRRERDRQVRIMGDIYRKARKVLVWLGPEEPSSARTIAKLKLIAMVEAVRESTRLGRPVLSILEKYLSNTMRKGNPIRLNLDAQGNNKATDPTWRLYPAFTSMVRSPWWYRVWTLQEQVLSRQCQVYHGRHSISISSFQAEELQVTIKILTKGDDHYNHHLRDTVHGFRRLHDKSARLGRDQNILQQLLAIVAGSLLEALFLLEAKHPIDKIYGLYGILTDYCNLPLSAPDYGRTAWDVFEETAWTWVRTRGDLSILKLAARPGVDLDLPSWVPAWHQQHPKFIRNVGLTTLDTILFFRGSHFDWQYPFKVASETSFDEVTEIQETTSIAKLVAPGRLRVHDTRHAGRVARIIGSGRSYQQQWDQLSMEYLQVHLEWCKLIHGIAFNGPLEPEEVLHEMFRSTQQPGVHQSKLGDDESLEELFESFMAWFNFVSHLNEGSGFPASAYHGAADSDHDRTSRVKLYYDVCAAKQDEEAADVLVKGYSGDVQGKQSLAELARHIRSAQSRLGLMRNYSLCILDNDNMIAITDYWCQEGDQVFVLPGTDSPFILRRVPHEDCYRVVGPALVDRLLRVGYQDWRSEGNDLQDIVLI